jgi:hypothetical protein
VQEKLMQELQISEWCEAPEIAGPGFINVKLRPAFVESRLKAMLEDNERLAVPRCVCHGTLHARACPSILRDSRGGFADRRI